MRTLATLALAACLGLGLVTPAGAEPREPLGVSAGDQPRDTLELRDEFFAGTTTGDARSTSPRAAARRPSWDPSLPQGRECTDVVCIHYVGTTDDAPPMTSSTGGPPDWVVRTLRAAHESFAGMVALGYPLPPSDQGAGGTAQFDVYLAELGGRGLYGYCAPERLVPGERNVASSFCVLDDYFAGFPLAAIPSMRVTVAHELFHAVQFGLDAREDGWFLEATATWMEEQIADDVDDNRQYLPHGQLGDPGTPLDTFGSGLGSYGNWIFFQRFSQHFGTDAVRRVWARADGHVGRPNLFSVRALKRFVQSRGVAWPRFYAGFLAANHTARWAYDEGSAYRPTAPLSRAVLGRRRPTWTREISLDHLTGQSLSARPAAGLRRARLRITVDAGRRATAPAAQVLLVGRRGVTARGAVRLDRRGTGSRIVRFDRPRVRRVEVVLANASTRYTCNRGAEFACHGRPRDDRQDFRVTMRVLPRPRHR